MNSAEDSGDWWKDYFDERYVRIYESFLGPAVTEHEVAGLRELLDDVPGRRVLDVGCGWGRHAVGLARAGFEVTALDRSSILLAEAGRRARLEGAEVRIVEADMRAIPFAGTFDVALSLFSSLGLLGGDAEDLAVLRSIRTAVVSGGLLIVDTMHRDSIARDYAEKDWWRVADGLTVWVEREFDPIAGTSEERLHWREPDGSEGEKRFTIRIRTASEWADLLAESGWKVLEWLGSWDLEPFTHTSERLIVLARRE